jgi:hypothetical protein
MCDSSLIPEVGKRMILKMKTGKPNEMEKD